MRLLSAMLMLPVLAAGCGESLTLAQKQQRIRAMAREYHSSFPEVPYITPAQLEKRLQAGSAVLIDVRPQAERRVSMIPDAATIAQLQKQRDAWRDKTLVFYCTIGFRSGKQAEDYRQQGFETMNLKGGILAWLHAGKAVRDADGPVKKVHVYGEPWNLAPAAYETVTY